MISRSVFRASGFLFERCLHFICRTLVKRFTWIPIILIQKPARNIIKAGVGRYVVYVQNDAVGMLDKVVLAVYMCITSDILRLCSDIFSDVSLSRRAAYPCIPLLS